jgi:WD40 repeat protein
VIQTGHKESINSVAISADGQTVVSGSDDYTVLLWDKETGKVIRQLQGHTDIKSEGRQIMTAGGADDTAEMSKRWNNHSVYTFYLLKGLRGEADYNRDKVISIRELQVYLDSTVLKEAKQTPQLFNLNNSEGQFVFYREGDK